MIENRVFLEVIFAVATGFFCLGYLAGRQITIYIRFLRRLKP